MKHPLYALLLLPPAALLIWVLWGSRPSTGMGFAPRVEGVAFAPADYNPETIFEYMNGAAELYLQHGFKALKVWTGKTDGVEVTVELYLLDSPGNAGALFDRLKGGEEGAMEETRTAIGSGAGTAQAGPFLLRAFTYPESEGPSRQALESFARWFHEQNG